MQNKIYVCVGAEFDTAGVITPKYIKWTNDEIFSIDKILEVRPASSLHSGGAGTRFKIKIGSNIRYLFCEGQNIMNRYAFCKWFISSF